MTQQSAGPARRVLTFFVTLAVLLASIAGLGQSARAAGTPTSIGLAEHGLMAYRDNWQYVYGGKGGDTDGDGLRESDCAGLIYAYFKDIGAEAGCYGGASSQVKYNCVFSGDVDELYGIPRIHGLVITMPDYNDPSTGIYSHIGIYLGNNMAADNSDYGTNMRYEPVVGSGRGWTAWHVFDNGTLYPSTGWYEFDGALYHYTNCQYDVDKVVDGITIGSDGIALGSGGEPLTADSPEAPALSTEYVSATTVAQQLESLGYSGKDSTADIIGGGDDVPSEDEFNGRITGVGVSLREEPTTQSRQLATLALDERVQILETVTGERLSNGDGASDQWCSVVTETGRSGYVWAPYVEQEASVEAPVFSVEDGRLVITAEEGLDIRYTTDGSRPTAESTPYTGPIHASGTYRAVAVRDGWTSPMATITFAGGSLFTDFTSDDWYFEHVDRTVELGLFSGNGDQTFTPTSTITRAQFAAALANLAGVNAEDYKGETGYNDVSGDIWYSGAVNWVTSQGIMAGIGGGAFWPEEPISREQICVAMANYAGLTYSGSSGTFADDSSIHDWAKEAVYACRELGLITGMGSNTFAPQDPAQRAQACAIVLNAYDAGL